MDMSVNQKSQTEVDIQYCVDYEPISIEIENTNETEHNEHIGFINLLKTDSKNEAECNNKSFFQGVTDIESTMEGVGEIFNYSSSKNALDLRIHHRNEEEIKSIFDDAEYFAKNYLYKLLPITFETVDESIIQNEHNYCHSYVSSESEAEGYCSRTMDFSQVREKNYKKRKTKAQESDTENEKGDHNKIHQNIVSFSSTFNTNCVADLVKENSSDIKSKPSQPLDLRAHLVQENKTDICLNYSQHSVLNFNNNNNVEEKKSDIESDSDKENLKSKLKCIEVTITGPGKKENYQPCDLFLNDIARLAPKLIGKDCGELNILDRTCDRFSDVKKPRLYYIISETTWNLFQSTNERIILTNDRSLGQRVEEKNTSEKPSFLVFDQYSLARYLADYCKEIGGCFEYACVEDSKEDVIDSVEGINTKQNQSSKEVKQCNDFDKETDVAKISLVNTMENKTEKKVELNREDDGRRTDTFNCLEKPDKRTTPFITRADKNIADSKDTMNCSNSNPEPSCEDFDSFSSQTAVSQSDCKGQKDKPKCRRKCDVKRKERRACKNLRRKKPNKRHCKKPKAKKCVSNSAKRSARKKCMAKKKSCQKGKKVVSRRSTRKSLRSMSRASHRRKSCASQRSTRSNVHKKGKGKKSDKCGGKKKRAQKCAFFNNIKRERPKACDLLKNSQFLKSGKLGSLKDAKKERPKVCELLKGDNKCGGGSKKNNKKSVVRKRGGKGKVGKGGSGKCGKQKKSGRHRVGKIAKKGKSVKKGVGRGKSCGRKGAAKKGHAKGKSRVSCASRGAKRGRSVSRSAKHCGKNKKLKKREASKSAKRGRSGVRKCDKTKVKKRNPSKKCGKQKPKVRGHHKYPKKPNCKKTVVRKPGKHEADHKRRKSVKCSESARSLKSKKSGESCAHKGAKRKRSSTRACDDGDEASKRKKSGRSEECGKAAKRKSSTHCSDVVRKRTRLEPKSSKKCGKSNKASGLKAKLMKKKEELKRRRQKKCHKRSESMHVKSRSQSSRGSCVKHQKTCHSGGGGGGGGGGGEHKRKKKSEGKDRCKRKR